VILRARLRRDSGAAAVEFALVLPLLLLILFGIIDFGRMLNAQITINEAAREGARAMALFDASAGGDRVAKATAELPGATYTVISACPVHPGPDDDAVIEVSYSFTFVTPLAAISGLFGGTGAYGTRTLTAQGLMPCMQR
jgi:hypothetical protein